MTRRARLLLATALLAAFATVPVAASADPAPSVTLSSDKTVYVAADTATFVSRVSAMNLDWVVAAQVPGSATWKVLCYARNVNTDTFKCTLGVYYNVTVRAQLIDDKGTTDPNDDTVEATATEQVPVRAEMGTQAFGYHATSGRYSVYPHGSSPKFRSATVPALPGKRCLRHQVQRRYSSGWRTVKTSACLTEQTQGRVDWTWTHSHPSGVNFRVRATFAGDAINRANNSSWLYFKFR